VTGVRGFWAAATDTTTQGLAERLVLALILCNTVAVVLSTVEPVTARYGPVLRGIEYVAVGAFTVEFVLRIASRLARPAPSGSRLARLRDPYLVVDLLAILPAYVGGTRGVNGIESSSLVRVLRLLKFVRYFKGVERLGRVVNRKRADLAASVFWTGLLWLVAASGVYFAERTAQPEAFSSIPAALWWAGVTITTVGYGDVYPVTPLGRLLGVVVALLGVGIAAVPSSILVSGFLEETGQSTQTCPHCGEEFDG